MFVCLCNSVSERQILAAIDAGAETVLDVARATGAGTDCGSCVGALQRYVELAGRREATPRDRGGCAAPAEAPGHTASRAASRHVG